MTNSQDSKDYICKEISLNKVKKPVRQFQEVSTDYYITDEDLIRVCGKKFFLGAGCRVLPIFRGSITYFSGKKCLNFPPDHSKVRHFLMSKKSKSVIRQGF